MLIVLEECDCFILKSSILPIILSLAASPTLTASASFFRSMIGVATIVAHPSELVEDRPWFLRGV